ncbi:structural protein [Cellulophaga phage phi4:1]|uniref:Structural protein n=3 Tax=Lightbulbvirus Cba41 TaxID=1918524 RepID=A0A0S2MWD1_9CAUD|nr:structural protein [Cellulophaga phage phi4:1]AGO49451.1 structural protein [Cellulophaga phage phi4:1]ALO80047.1 structural protein [Cellulophaga phage phi4:1_13]ALO80244.1 structural protein [Cellulophaga phage phi4:1_18]
MLENNTETEAFDPTKSLPPKEETSPVKEMDLDIKKNNPDPLKYASIKTKQSSLQNDIFAPETKLKTFNYDANLDNAYTKLNSGKHIAKFENFLSGSDNEDRLARKQSTGEQWGNGLTKLIGKTSTAVLGGTIGTVNGVINGVLQGSLEATYNNDFDKWLDDLNTKMDNNLPNYYTEQQKNQGLWDSMGTANFWANDVTSGLSFTLGTIVSEGIWAAATGGTSLIAKGAMGGVARWGAKALSTKSSLAALNKYKSIAGKAILRRTEKEAVTTALAQGAKRGTMLSKTANNARFLVTSAGYEAGVEARHYMKSTKENWLDSFEELNGRAPTASEQNDFDKDLSDYANYGVFLPNMALVGASNIAMFGSIIKGSPINQTVKNSLLKNKLLGIGYKTVDGKKVALQATKAQKAVRGAYTFGKYGTLEGVVEEGGQGVITSTGEDFMLETYKTENIDNSISIIDSMLKGFEESYGTKEGQKSIGIGVIIGIFGGGISTKGRFNEMSSEQAEVENLVNKSNTVTSELVVNRIKELSRIENATRKESEAKDSGDLTGEVTARKELMQARAIRDIRLGGISEGVKDLEAYLEKTSDSEIAEVLGIEELNEETSELVSNYRSEILSEYKNIAEKTQKNLNLAESILGTSPIAGASEYNIKDLSDRMAYTLTMGEASDEIADGMISSIKDIVSGNLGIETTDVLTVENVLRKVDPKNLSELRGLRTQLTQKQQREKALQEKLVDLQSVSKTDNESYAANLNKANKELLKTQQEIQELQAQRETTFAIANIATFSDGQVTLDMLDSQSKNLEIFRAKLGVLKPNDKENVERLMTNYESATRQTKQFNKSIELFTNPDTRVSVLNGWLSKLINKNKELDTHLDKYFKETTETAEVSTLSQLGALTGPPKVQAPVATAPVNTNTSTQENLSVIEKLENEIQELLKKDNYLKQYIGDDVEPNLNKEDTDRFSELLAKINGVPQEVLTSEYTKGKGLTSEESEEFKNLNKKLNNWRVIDGSGIGDKLLLIEALKTEVETSNTAATTSIKEIVLASRPVGSKDGSQNVNTVQSPSIKVAKYVEERGTYEISHTEIQSLLGIIPNSTITYKGKDISLLNKKELKKVGNEFILNAEGKEVKIRVVQYNRLEVNKTELEEVLPQGTHVVDFSISSFMPLYVNGKVVPGDFGYENANGEVINYNEDYTNDIQKGDSLITEIDINDSYNKDLLEQYNKGKITKEELSNNLNIYLKPKDAPTLVVGSLRALSDRNDTSVATSALIELRNAAVDKVIEGIDERADLGVELPVEKVLLGNPNITIDEQGKPKTIPFTTEAAAQVVATGYVLDEQVTLNRNIKFNPGLATRISRKNKGQKIPVVVFKYRNQTIAYPVNLIETGADLSTGAEAILNTALSSNQKAEKFVKFLGENKIDPNSFGIDYSANNWENSTEAQGALDSLTQNKITPDVETWTEDNFDPSNLIQQAEISVDITDRPILASKIILKIENRVPYNNNQAKLTFREALEQKRIALVESISEEAIALDSMFKNTVSLGLTVAEEDSDFLMELQDSPVNKDPIDYLNKKYNANKVIAAFSHRIPKRIKNIIGATKIDSIKYKIGELNRIVEIENAAQKPEKTSVISTIATISNGDKVVSVDTKPLDNEIKSISETFIDKDLEDSRVYINIEPLKEFLVVPNNTLTIVDKNSGNEVVSTELNPEGAVVFEAMQGRLFVVANINGQTIPFYKSSAGTSGKEAGSWYPFFGYTGAWLVKGEVVNGKMTYSKEIDNVTNLLNENFVFPDKYISRKDNIARDSRGVGMIDFNNYFKINRLEEKGKGITTGNKSQYTVEGLKENTRAESALVALITGLNTSELSSSGTVKENKEWLDTLTGNIQSQVLTEEEISEIVESLLGDEIETVEELLPELIKGFYNKGIFNPSIKSLVSTKLYDSFQAATLMSNLPALQKIDKLITKLQDNGFMC